MAAPSRQSTPGASYSVEIRGVSGSRFADVYHAFLAVTWPIALSAIVVAFLLTNLIFAVVYAVIGGVANAAPGSVLDGFFFSVQTLATIGYGGMSPVSTTAHGVVVVEAVVGMLITALSTGLVFAKFSQPQGRIVFSRVACVAEHEGVPTLIIRVGNERGNRVIGAMVHLDVSRTTRDAFGREFYKMISLEPVRARIPALSRTFQIMHRLDERSPLFGLTAERAALDELELTVSVVGLDDTTGQSVHGQWMYEVDRLRFGWRFVDVLYTDERGVIVLDVSRFHDVEPIAP